MNHETDNRLAADLLRPVLGTSRRFYVAVAFFSAIVLCGLATWGYQIYSGFGVTGYRWPVYWALHETNFVFWIGISHAGTLISAILRIVNATWRRPVTRCAEVITAFALMIGAAFPLIHLGRPWLAWWLIPYPSERGIWPNFRSPLVWDFFAINTYLTASLLFLILPAIPDFALIRDRTTGLRKRIYGLLSMGWQGTPKQWHRLESAMHIMALAIIPIAISVHTIVSFDFSMAVVPMWHSSIFGPYFVVGAIFSGIAALIIVMALLRKLLNLEEYLLPLHFENLGKLMLAMSLLWGYFVFNERLVVWYGNEPHEMNVFWSTQTGEYAPLFWTMVICNFVIPFPLLAIKRLRSIATAVIASCGVVAGMWLERFLIIVPSLARKSTPYSWGHYLPQWPELVIMAASFGAMVLLYLLFSKFIPIISVWELKAGRKGSKMTAIYGLYTTPEAAQRAFDSLLASGVAEKDIAVMSSEPFGEHGEYSFASGDRHTVMPWIAVLGAAIGLVTAYLMTSLTQKAWAINTGGMPIVSTWTNIIIMFELTMLGAVFATVIALMKSARLPRRLPKFYDPEISEGKILVGVRNPDASRASAVEIALKAGAPASVKTV